MKIKTNLVENNVYSTAILFQKHSSSSGGYNILNITTNYDIISIADIKLRFSIFDPLYFISVMKI